MNKKILVIGLTLVLLTVVLSGCEEEDIKSICDETKATPIVVELVIIFTFHTAFSNFDKVDSNQPSIWWFNKNINKCGEGGKDYSYHEKDATYENLGQCKFPSVPVYVDNELDEVYIEGGLNHGGSTFYTSKYLSYSELRSHAGGTYDVILDVTQVVSNIIVPAIYVFIETSDADYFGDQNIRIDIYSQGLDEGGLNPYHDEFTYYRKTLLPDGYTEKIYLNPVYLGNPENSIKITATHLLTGTIEEAIISGGKDIELDYYYDFKRGTYVLDKKITIKI